MLYLVLDTLLTAINHSFFLMLLSTCMQEVSDETLLYQGVEYPGAQALTLHQLEQFIARVRSYCL